MVKQRQEKVFLVAVIVGALVLAGSLAMFHCSSPTTMVEQHARNNLPQMGRCSLQVKNMTVQAWIARTYDERELGLMWVRPEEMTDNQGMLFIFDEDQAGGFWMKNTLIPLDIAFIRHDGTVVDIQQMEALSLVAHTPRDAYRFALELKAGTLAKAGLQTGDIVQVPADVASR